MFKLVVLVSLVACALGSVVPRRVKPQLDGRVIGGEDTNISKVPYQLSLMTFGVHTCGASLLSPTIALTAAHCVRIFIPRIMTIRAGATDNILEGIDVKVSTFRYHPKYNSTDMQYDVAVLKLAAPLPLGPNIGTIQLVKEAPVDGTKATISGWGKTEDYYGSPVLQSADVKIVSQEVCASSAYDYGNAIKATMICANANGKDSCQGDSGGPLVVEDGLAGIVSWGYNCAEDNYPGVYTDVAAVRTWILETADRLLK